MARLPSSVHRIEECKLLKIKWQKNFFYSMFLGCLPFMLVRGWSAEKEKRNFYVFSSHNINCTRACKILSEIIYHGSHIHTQRGEKSSSLPSFSCGKLICSRKQGENCIQRGSIIACCKQSFLGRKREKFRSCNCSRRRWSWGWQASELLRRNQFILIRASEYKCFSPLEGARCAHHWTERLLISIRRKRGMHE